MYGCLVGIPNYGSVFFLLKALTSLPAVLVYPTYSAGTIFAISLIGVTTFGERPRKRQWAALGMILVALVLLNYKKGLHFADLFRLAGVLHKEALYFRRTLTLDRGSGLCYLSK